MSTLPACRPWSCKGLRTFDSFSRGPARFVLVNDGEAEVPALLMSQELFTIVNRAVTADHDYEKDLDAGLAKIHKHLRTVDSARGNVEAVKIKIRHLKTSIKHGKAEMNKELPFQLAALYEEKAASTRHIKEANKAIKKIRKAHNRSKKELKNVWKGLDLVMEEVWERAGFFDIEIPQNHPPNTSSHPMPSHNTKNVGDIIKRAQDLLSKRYQSVHEARQRYEHHLENPEQAFVAWHLVNGVECANRYEIDEQKDVFYNDYKKRALDLCREVEEKETSFKKEYELCQQLGLEVHSFPVTEAENYEHIIRMIDREAISSFEKQNRKRVDAWRETIPYDVECHHISNERYNHEGTASKDSSRSGDVLHPGHSLSCHMSLNKVRQHISSYEELRKKPKPESRFGRGESTNLVHDIVSGPVFESEAPRSMIYCTSPIYSAASNDATGSNIATSQSTPTPPTTYSIPPFGSFHKTVGQIDISQLKSWNPCRAAHNTVQDVGNLEHHKAPQSASGRKRKVEELNDSAYVCAPKRRKAGPSQDPGNARSECSNTSLPLMDRWMNRPPDLSHSIEADKVASISQESDSIRSDLSDHRHAHSSLPKGSSEKPLGSFSPRLYSRVMHIAQPEGIASSSTPALVDSSSAQKQKPTGRAREHRTYRWTEDEDLEEC